jgi:RNA polymerase sigma factor (sigma-70 family)
MSDAEIISQIKSGEHGRALKKLYGYFSPVRQLVLNNSGNKQDAEDLYQEGLIILFRKVKQTDFELRSSLNTFLFGICRLLWNEELKRRNRKPLSYEENPGEIFPDHNFEESLQNESNFRKAEAAFKLIGEKCQELLQLFYIKKMSMQQIAVKFGFSTERVAKNQKYRCLEKAKEELKKIHPEKILS